VGFGESGAWGFLEASAAAMEKFGRYLVGKDPLQIEHHWQNMYRTSYFRGAAIMGALSALDIALWDIAGKHLGVPAYHLLGGKTRNKARVYYHVYGDTREAGFTAVGHLTPFLDEAKGVPFFKTHADKMGDAIEAVAAYREAAGTGVDLCIEIQRQLTPTESITLEGYRTIPPAVLRGSHPAGQLRRDGPSRTERVDTHRDRGAPPLHQRVCDAAGAWCRAVHPPERVSGGGGLTHSKKIAAVAEAHYVGVVPHNPLSPMSTAACLQLAAGIPNFIIQEYPIGELESPKSEIVTEPLKQEGGFLMIPDGSGIGVELADDA
jgi:galactonate dehydratase